MTAATPARRPAQLVLVIGGASSGKSELALRLAGKARPRAFVATGQPLDDEMTARIERHRASRESDWETAEVPADLVKWFETHRGRYRVVLLDCLTLWLSNLMGGGVPADEISRQTSTLIHAMRSVRGRVIIVTNELGMSVVPVDRETRRFREVAGAVNQQVAEAADAVYLAVAGLSVRMK